MHIREFKTRTPAKTKRVVLFGKCTTCKKTWEMTPAQRDEARDIGCAFSPCCHAVATVDFAVVKR